MNTTATKSLAELNKDLETAQNKLISGGYKDEDFKAIKAIQASIEKFEADKAINVKSITDKITAFGFNLNDIFTYAEIKKAGYVKADTATSSTNKTTTTRTPTVRASDKALELFNIPKGVGKGARGFVYNKGRIYEDASSTIKTPYAAISKALESNVKSKEDLMKFVSATNKAEATAYLNSPDGQKEVRAILAYIKDEKATTEQLKKIA